MPLTLSEYKKLQTQHERGIEEFAKRVRRELIIPVCQKHDLEFESGMGSWNFKRQDGKFIGGYSTFEYKEDEIENKQLQQRYGLTKIVELLSQNTGNTDLFDLGVYCADVRRGIDYHPGKAHPKKRSARRKRR